MMMSVHRLLGTAISIFFLMWFITGLVLVYKSFPNISKAEKYDKLETLPGQTADIQEIIARIPAGSNIQDINIKQFQGQTLYTLKTKDSTYVMCADTTQNVKPIDHNAIQSVIKRWIDAPVVKIDTLHKRDQWIMYSSYKRKMPIYKYQFDDDAKHQLYIAANTAEVLQLTNKNERLWAYIGAIPHKLYFPFLRRNTSAWIHTLTTFGIILLIVSITGFYIGIKISRKRYKTTRQLSSPYRKRTYRWHHIGGLIFGIFIITWSISAAMALQRVPQCIVKTHNNIRINSKKIRGKHLTPDKYILDYRTLFQTYTNIKEISWNHYQDTPIYTITAGDKIKHIDASTTEPKELYLQEDQINKTIHKIHGDNVEYSISLINEYDNYYMSLDNDRPLPVYKIEIADKDKSTYYINPRTGKHKYVNQNKRARKWVFSGLHYFNIKYLADHPALWTAIMWILCLGGIVVTGTGVIMGGSYIKRRFF